MPEFMNPFSGILPSRKLTERELTRALRLSLAAEEEAIHLYEALADATGNKLAKKVLQDIANEEKVHAGEFQRLLSILLKDEDRLLEEGAEEVNEMTKEVEKENKDLTKTVEEIATVGDMKK
jgi:rubrerythrin